MELQTFVCEAISLLLIVMIMLLTALLLGVIILVIPVSLVGHVNGIE